MAQATASGSARFTLANIGAEVQCSSGFSDALAGAETTATASKRDVISPGEMCCLSCRDSNSRTGFSKSNEPFIFVTVHQSGSDVNFTGAMGKAYRCAEAEFYLARWRAVIEIGA